MDGLEETSATACFFSVYVADVVFDGALIPEVKVYLTTTGPLLTTPGEEYVKLILGLTWVS